LEAELNGFFDTGTSHLPGEAHMPMAESL